MADNRNETADKVKINPECARRAIYYILMYVYTHTFLHQLKKHVHETFEHVRKALELRERLLTRQIDVLMNTTTPHPNLNAAKSVAGRPLPLIDQLKFMPQNEAAVLEHIRRLGKFNVDNYKFYSDPTFAIEDYICPNVDHDLMYKCLLKCNDDVGNEVERQQQRQHQLLSPVANSVPSIQVTDHHNLSEPKELLDRSRSRHEPEKCGAPQQAPENATDEQRIAKMLIDNLNNDQPTSDTLHGGQHKGSKKSKRKSKAQNGGGLGCGGTINLKNISSLTINTMCSRENSVKKPSKSGAEKKKQQQQPLLDEAADVAPVAEAATANATGSTPLPKSTSDVIMDTHSTMEISSNTAMSDGTGANSTPVDYGCEFYNRLIAEIKQTMKAQTTTPKPVVPAEQQPLIARTSLGYDASLPTTPTSSAMSLSLTSSSSGTTPTAFTLSTLSESSPLSSVPTSPSTAATSAKHECSKMLFQNIRNLRITLPAANVSELRAPGSGTVRTDQPVLIEEWLKQIGNETEVEPSANADILEHSLINHESMSPKTLNDE